MKDDLSLILTYHSISSGPDPLCLTPHQLEEHLDLLSAAGFEALSASRMLRHLAGAEPSPGRNFTLTFDDGYLDFLDAALPVLERRRLPATLFVSAAADRGRLASGPDAPLLCLDQLHDLTRRGVEIGAHTVDHPDLTALDDADLERELVDCRRILERHVETPVELFAYPFGLHDTRVREAAGKHFRAAFTTRLAEARPGVDRLAVPRLDAYYLGSPLLRRLLARGRPQPYLTMRRWLRQLRGSEPRV